MELPGEFSPFIEKKVVFCLVVGGVTPPYTLSGSTTKKTFFLCVSSLTHARFFLSEKVKGIQIQIQNQLSRYSLSQNSTLPLLAVYRYCIDKNHEQHCFSSQPPFLAPIPPPHLIISPVTSGLGGRGGACYEGCTPPPLTQ